MQPADQHVVPDVELSPLVEQWLLYVFLNDVGFLTAVEVLLLLLEDSIQLVNLINHCDSLSSIRQLSWLHNPNIFQ